jgi:hypothetical protein
MTCVILQDDSELAEDHPHVAEHPSRSGEDLSGRKLESTEDPLGLSEDPSTQLLPWWWIRKNHYVAPPLVPTTKESRSIIKQISDR